MIKHIPWTTPIMSTVFLLIFLLCLLFSTTTSSIDGFFFNTFTSFSTAIGIALDGSAAITPHGALQLTNTTSQVKGHAFYHVPLKFKSTATSLASSFSTSFVFVIVSALPKLSGNGIAFFISPNSNFSAATGSQYLGLLNRSTDGDFSNHLFFVELDTIFNPELSDINDNHVGININTLRSFNSTPAGYHEDSSDQFLNLTLISGDRMQVWIDYDGISSQLNVTLAPVEIPKPRTPLISTAINLSSIVNDSMYVGFSSSTGTYRSSHYILGWSFQINGKAPPLRIADLPPLTSSSKNKQRNIWIALIASSFILFAVLVILSTVRRRMALNEQLEDWEQSYSTYRFKYNDLRAATRGFSSKRLLGTGGFGEVFHGTLPSLSVDIAVKRISHGSKQGIREFVAEVVSLGHLRHRNLVPLLGYCRRNGELLLVYEFMPHGSLDNLFRSNTVVPLTWKQRLTVIKGVASALHYLHEGWEKAVVHRDIKASNVMLDGDLRARLGDFGLARLHDHSAAPGTTRVVGTLGYLAPEVARTGRATKASDIYAFGVLLLEVVCGRRPLEPAETAERMVLVDWVAAESRRGRMSVVVDGKMGGVWEEEDVERVVRIGLLCAHPMVSTRPKARRVVELLDREVPVPEIPPGLLNANVLAADNAGSGSGPDWSSEEFITNSVLWAGR